MLSRLVEDKRSVPGEEKQFCFRVGICPKFCSINWRELARISFIFARYFRSPTFSILAEVSQSGSSRARPAAPEAAKQRESFLSVILHGLAKDMSKNPVHIAISPGRGIWIPGHDALQLQDGSEQLWHLKCR